MGSLIVFLVLSISIPAFSQVASPQAARELKDDINVKSGGHLHMTINVDHLSPGLLKMLKANNKTCSAKGKKSAKVKVAAKKGGKKGKKTLKLKLKLKKGKKGNKKAKKGKKGGKKAKKGGKKGKKSLKLKVKKGKKSDKKGK